jgi:Holliday junction resolvase-like predicted endonuclease
MYQRYLTGNYGESLVQLFLKMCGFNAIKPVDNGCGDLLVTNDSKSICVEIKTAHKGRDNKWRFTLEKHKHMGITENINFLVLVALIDDESVFFVIPADVIRGRRHIVITSNPKTYSGMFSEYRYAWDNIMEFMG